jgi:hypothetical protein
VFDVHVILKLEQENKLELVSFQKKEKTPLDLEVERLLVQIIEEKTDIAELPLGEPFVGLD